MSDLYSQRSNYYLSLSEQRIIIKNDNKEIVKEVSISLVDNVLLFGNAQLTTQLIKALSKNKVNGYYFSNVGQFISSIVSVIFRKLIPLQKLWVTKVALRNPIFTI